MSETSKVSSGPSSKKSSISYRRRLHIGETREELTARLGEKAADAIIEARRAEVERVNEAFRRELKKTHDPKVDPPDPDSMFRVDERGNIQYVGPAAADGEEPQRVTISEFYNWLRDQAEGQAQAQAQIDNPIPLVSRNVEAGHRLEGWSIQQDADDDYIRQGRVTATPSRFPRWELAADMPERILRGEFGPSTGVTVSVAFHDYELGAEREVHFARVMSQLTDPREGNTGFHIEDVHFVFPDISVRVERATISNDTGLIATCELGGLEVTAGSQFTIQQGPQGLFTIR